MPGIVNSLLIKGFGYLYTEVSNRLVELENHRYVSGYENSLVNKTYMFKFVNTYIGNFVIIAYNQNFYSLSMNLFIVMVFQQIIFNLFDLFYEKYKVYKDNRKVDNLFAKKIEESV